MLQCWQQWLVMVRNSPRVEMQKEVDIWTKYTRDGRGWSFIPNVLEVVKTRKQWHCWLITALMYFAHCLSPVALQLRTSGEN